MKELEQKASCLAKELEEVRNLQEGLKWLASLETGEIVPRSSIPYYYKNGKAVNREAVEAILRQRAY
jgi:hypothetical protein